MPKQNSRTEAKGISAEQLEQLQVLRHAVRGALQGAVDSLPDLLCEEISDWESAATFTHEAAVLADMAMKIKQGKAEQ
jgi:hypothetical protein